MPQGQNIGRLSKDALDKGYRNERAYLRALITANSGNVRQAAKAAGVSREAFYQAMKRNRMRVVRSGKLEGLKS